MNRLSINPTRQINDELISDRIGKKARNRNSSFLNTLAHNTLDMSSSITNNKVVEESVRDELSVSSDSVCNESVKSDSSKSSEHKSGTEQHSNININFHFDTFESGLPGKLIILDYL